jgi:hypothetical protein
MSEPPWVEHEGKQLPLHLVDPTKNAHRRRPPRRGPRGDGDAAGASTHFDPPSALLDKVSGRAPNNKEIAR